MRKFTIVNKGNRTAEILFYGEIYYWGKNSSENLSNKLRELDKENDNIIIRMNSVGGSVIEASAIYSTIKSIKAHVTIVVEGVAASAASFILLAANKVEISKAGRIMIHKFSGGAFGNSADLRSVADSMDSWEKDWIGIYAEKMGMTPEAVTSEYFQAHKDTWISPKQAIELKLADEIVDGVVKNSLENIENSTPDLAEAYYQNQILNNNLKIMDKDQLARIGLPENASKEQIDARLIELADKEKLANTSTAQQAEAATQKKDEVVTASTDPEVVTLRNKVAAMEKAEIDKVINDAIDAKKIVAAAKPQYEKVGAQMGIEDLKAMLANLSPALMPNDITNPKSPVNGGEYETLEALLREGDDVAESFKAKHPAKFNALWKKEYGTDYLERQ